MFIIVTYISHIICPIPPKCVKTKEPKDEHCVLQCNQINNYICDTIPLDNSSNIVQIDQHCLT